MKTFPSFNVRPSFVFKTDTVFCVDYELSSDVTNCKSWGIGV